MTANTQPVVIHESMYGNTRRIAEAIAEGMGVLAVPVARADNDVLNHAELVVVGAPTHAWHLPSPRSRQAAAEGAAKTDSGVHLEPEATGSGVREWMADPASHPRAVAVFDTRVKMPRAFSGSAARHMAKLARRRRTPLAAPPTSFFVTKDNRLLDGELERARAFGAELAPYAQRNASG